MATFAIAIFLMIITPGPGVLSLAGTGAGFGWRPTNQISNANTDVFHEQWQTNKEELLNWMSIQPTHYQYLKESIYSK